MALPQYGNYDALYPQGPTNPSGARSPGQIEFDRFWAGRDVYDPVTGVPDIGRAFLKGEDAANYAEKYANGGAGQPGAVDAWREYDAAAKAYPEPAYDPAQGRPGIWDPRTQTYSPFPDPGPFNPWEGYMSGGIAGSGALPGGQEFLNATTLTTPNTPTTPTTPTPAPAWYKPESDPSGSMWDAFQKSLNQATMPAQFRATWGGG